MINTFKEDLKRGQEKEIQFIDLLKSYGWDIVNHNNDYKYDIRATYKNKDFKFEVKRDDMAMKTNHIFIEFIYNSKDSGIRKTEADYYIIYVGDIYLIIDVNDLKGLINTCQYKNIRSTTDNKTQGYLFNINLIMSLNTPLQSYNSHMNI